MKNTILTPALLPTEEASHLYLRKEDNTLWVTENALVDMGEISEKSNTKNQHLYLCSTLPIKVGNWYYRTDSNELFKCKSENDTEPYSYKKKIELTTDPKLIADGIGKIDGNTKAKFILKEYMNLPPDTKEVNFLEEFCKRYNQKDNQKDGYDEWMEMVGNQKVNMEKLTEEGQKTDAIIDLCFKKSGIAPKHKEVYGIGIVDGYNQALQSNAGGFSLEDMRKAYQAGMDYMDLLPEEAQARGVKLLDKEEYIQSLTKEQFNGNKPVYDEFSKIHDWVCDKMERISQEQINKDATTLGMYRAYRNVVMEMERICPPSSQKCDVVIECEMERVPVNHASGLELTGHPTMDRSILENYKIKLTNGQPTLIFK